MEGGARQEKRGDIMSDNEIREILVQRKRKARRAARREEIRDCIEGFIGFGGLMFICFMLSVIGG